MKCPKCGYEWIEGHLYCDSCGEEIRIVPDFEPEIEKEMNETLSSLFIELAEEEVPELSGVSMKKEPRTEEEQEGEEDKQEDPARVFIRKRRRVILSACGFLVLLGICILGSYLYRTYSVTYQMEEAKECAGKEAYTQAITYLERAHELEPQRADILFLMADYYYLQGKYEMAVASLAPIIENPDLYLETELESAYDKTISVYKGMGEYQAIHELLLACKKEEIVTTFQQYIAKPPEFSFVEGSYEEVIPLKLSANASGKIYYTLDGTTPNENSEVYTAPIFLETGSYTVTAYFENDYGIKSDVVANTYRIDLAVPAAPEISVYSGDYEEPYMIEATAAEGCSIYYTTDSSDPTPDSFPYTAAIPMPLGKSVYKFIAVSPEGVVSDTIIRTYKLTLHTEITIDMAVSNVIQALIGADVLLDENGKMRGMAGRNVYKYNSVVRIDGYGDYYVIYEYYEDATGLQSRTERMYGVSIQDGKACRITYDEAGKIILLDI